MSHQSIKNGESTTFKYVDRRWVCLEKNDDVWSFLWGAELLYVKKHDWGWAVSLMGSEWKFESLWEALDWLDEQQFSSISGAYSLKGLEC